MKDLNTRQKTIRILENTDSNLFDISPSNFLLDVSLEARETKVDMNYWDFKIKASAQQRKQSTKLEDNLWNGEIYFQMTYLIKGYYPKSIKNLSNSTPQK